MRKIGLIGYFKFGNFGDELFIDVYKKYISVHHFSILYDKISPPYINDIDSELNNFDMFIIAGGD
jgi:polysaccharide pyruvyl transferase WcaK-like protein